MKKMACELVGWDKVHHLSRLLAHRIRQSGYLPDIIIAVERGGYIPARLLSDFLNLMNITGIKVEHYAGAEKNARAVIRYGLQAPIDGLNVLLVDDVSDSGDTFTEVLRHLQTHGTPKAVKTAVMQHKIQCPYVPDYYAERVEQWHWIIYPWAVTEDLIGFISAMSPRPPTVEGIIRQIETDFRIRVSHEQVQDALWCL